MRSTRAIPRFLVGLAFCIIAAVVVFSALVVWPRWMRDQAVSMLLDPEHRDKGMFYLRRHPIYRFQPRYSEAVPRTIDDCKVNHVVMCPQPEGDSLYAVFMSGEASEPGKPKGRVFLIDNQGALLRHSFKVTGEFKDINRDGIIDWVEPSGWEATTGVLSDCLRVVPVTRAWKPSLIVAYHKQSIMMSRWWWRITDEDGDGVCNIEFGSRRNPSKVVYRWSRDDHCWVGPDGAFDLRFMRFDPDENWPDIEAYTNTRPADWNQGQ